MAEPSGRGRRLLATVGLLVAFVIGTVLAGAVLVVRGGLLDATTYSSALVNVDAYERAYTEVLADPELADLKEQLLGQLGLGPQLSVQARALGTNALRWVVPPSTLRAGTETIISAVLAYVRGDTDRLDAAVAIDDVLARVDDTAVTEARTLLAAAADRTVAGVDAYRVAVAEVADQLAAGTIPESIPKIGGREFDPAEVVDALLDALGDRVDDDIRLQVTAAVMSGDERDALITAAGALVTEHAADVAARLGAEGRELDVVNEIAERARRPAAGVVASLDTTRDAARWFRPATAVIGVLIAIGAMIGLGWLYRSDRRRGASIAGLAFVIAGLANLVLWWIVAMAVRPPLADATATGSGSWRLPAGLRAVLADLQREIGGQLTSTVVRLTAVLVVTGAVLVVGTRLKRVALVAVVGLAGFLLAGGVVVVSRSDPRPGRECNGHAELCDRRYDEVVQAATHNSMSSPDAIPVWPEHDGDLTAQLDAGVRTLLIDTHYWPPVTGAGALTSITQPAEPRLPAGLVDAVYGTLGDLRGGREGTFLCHIHCVFGAIPFADSMVAVREFLEQNPDEVVTLIVQDAITPEDTAEVMDATGLGPYLYDHSHDGQWPTLGELIERDERLVVFAEDERPPPDWYANAFAAMKETPFLFLSPEQFSCAPNRGVEDAPLFQMNHWVQRIAPDRVDSVNVNRHDVLVDRARQCKRERGQLPNYLAVNFYNIGDVMEAVDTLNGV